MNVKDDALALGDGGLRCDEAEQLSCVEKVPMDVYWKVESVKVGVWGTSFHAQAHAH